MNQILSILLPLIAASTAACGDNVKYYQKSDVEIIEISKSTNSATIIFRPILDSLYYCPGATSKTVENRTKISFIRCSLSAKCQVDIIAKDLGQDKLQITISNATDQIDLVFKDGEIAVSAQK